MRTHLAEWMVLAALVLGASVATRVVRERDDPVRLLFLAPGLASGPFLRGVYGPDRLGDVEILESVGGRSVRDEPTLRAALGRRGPGSISWRWRGLDGGAREIHAPWPPKAADRVGVLGRVGATMAAGVGLALLSLWFRRNAEPVENRTVSFFACWLAGLSAFALVDYHWGARFTLWGASLYPIANFLQAPAIAHVSLLLLSDGRYARARPALRALPYGIGAAWVVAVVAAGQAGNPALVGKLRVANGALVGAASLLAGVGLALSDARAKRRMQAATGDLEERNRHLAEANERLALLAHNLQIALGELERHQRRTAAVLTEEAAMGRAVANLAHTFQRPLVPLYNFLDKLESERAEFGVLGERYGKLIPEMVHRIDDLIRICRFVLAMPGKEVPQDLSEIAREVAALARRDAERLGRNVRVEVVSEPLPRIRASRTDLFFTLHELTTNAVRALASGGHVWIRMSAEPAEAPAHARLEVSDDGPGIDPDRLGRIFEPYHTTSRDESRGLGLYLVERAVARMGGEIRVSSAPGTGTLFVIRLPVGAESPPRTETS